MNPANETEYWPDGFMRAKIRGLQIYALNVAITLNAGKDIRER